MCATHDRQPEQRYPIPDGQCNGENASVNFIRPPPDLRRECERHVDVLP